MPPKPRTRKPPLKAVPRDTDIELDALLVENTPDVVDPGYDGHMLRIAGMPWEEVARAIGSPNSRHAMQTVSSYLQKAAASQSAQQQQEAMQTQLDRYETMLQKWWTAATAGQDEKAAGVVLRVLERLDRLQRLTEGDVVVTKETLVISANPEQYVKQLQNVVSDREAGHK